MADLFDEGEKVALTAGQSLALREMIEALKRDDSVFDALPATIRAFVSALLMPVYTTAENEMVAIRKESEDRMATIEKLANKIHTLERQLAEHRARRAA